MNGANRVVVLRIERSEPVHISEVISELLPKLVGRPEPAANGLEPTGNGRASTNRLTEARQPCI